MPLPLDRSQPGFHHLGDLTLRLRREGSTGGFSRFSTVAVHPWKDDGAVSSDTPVRVERTGRDGGVRTSVTMDASACVRPEHATLRVVREVAVDGAEATIRWTLSNRGTAGIEVGALGLSMPFNQMFTGRQLPQVARRCSFTEVYIGGDAGYVQVRRHTCDASGCGDE